MAEEIELKFRLAEPDPLRRRLLELGASGGGRVLEINRIYDLPDGRLLAADCGLRLRIAATPGEPPAAVLTFKGPRHGQHAKIREELECAVEDGEVLAEILRRLGYVCRVHFEKRRETWYVRECMVTLDEVPRLGWWTEIEADSLESIEYVRQTLELAQATPVRETYVELVVRHGDLAADGCRTLFFPPSTEELSDGRA